MPDSTITLTIHQNGALITPTTVEFEDPTDTFGVRRADTLVVEVTSGTAIPEVGTGIYELTFSHTTPVPDQYEYAYEIVHSNVTYSRTFIADVGAITNTLILPDIASFFTSQAEVYNVLGAVAAELMEDDFASTNRVHLWTEILGSVTESMQLYLHQYYSTSNLNSTRWVRRSATILAANQLSNRRGSAPLFTDRVDRIYNELDEMRAGKLTLVGTATIGYQGPMVRNYELETQRRRHPLRIESTLSMMGDSYGGQDISWEYPFWY